MKFKLRFSLPGASDCIDATCRCMFGVEPQDMSLLYFLAYCNAAGGFEPLISANEEVGGQEFKIKVQNNLDTAFMCN